jgi:hypothetical protein
MNHASFSRLWSTLSVLTALTRIPPFLHILMSLVYSSLSLPVRTAVSTISAHLDVTAGIP